MKKCLMFAFFVFLSFVVFFSCKTGNRGAEKDEELNHQKEIVDSIFNDSGIVDYVYFDNGLIKKAYIEDSSKNNKGWNVEFYESGGVKDVYYINFKGKMAGNRTLFDTNGDVDSHYYIGESERIYFKADFENGQLDSVKGDPWFVYGKMKYSVGDTCLIYIATPVIPGYESFCRFGSKKLSGSFVEFSNESRIKYRHPLKEKGSFKYDLKFFLFKNDSNIVYSDSTNFEVVVEPSSKFS